MGLFFPAVEPTSLGVAGDSSGQVCETQSSPRVNEPRRPTNTPPTSKKSPLPPPAPNRSTVGGGGLYNGSDKSYSGFPGYPFDNPNRYFRTRQAGNIAFALVNNAPVNVTSKDMSLYFDWFVDNPWPYWFVMQTMSINANHSDIVVHQARVDLYDYDKLTPPGNFTQLASMLFDIYDSQAGDAYLGPVLEPEAIASTPNLASMATEVPLADYYGKRVLLAFRYSTNVNYIGWGIDNVMIVDCSKDAGEGAKKEEIAGAKARH